MEAPAECSPIFVKTAATVRTVVRKIHEPYWRLGRRFEELRAYQEKHELAGTMFLRFGKNPIRAATETLEFEIGFVLQQDHVARYPYRTAMRKAELVASMIVKQRAVNMRSDYPKVIEWALANGYQPTGPIMEVYRRQKSPSDPAPVETEVLVSVRKLSVGRSEDAGVATREKIERRGYKTPPLDRTLPEMVQRDTKSDTVSAPIYAERRTIRELTVDGDFDAIAEALLPQNARVPESRQVWLGHIVFRVRALADGAKRIGADDAAIIAAISDALSKRYDAVSDTFALDPLKSPVASGTGPKGRGERAIMQELDTLLGRVAFGLPPSVRISRELADILDRAKNLLWSKS
ncbi:MAG: hypothetical protein O7H40_16075 [Gammaproteobacteria bacterium]|nr:hypothetical protein [Gammaproteobacteria bacterium]